MKILALETSSYHGSMALLEDGQVTSQHALADSMRTAQSLAPAIKDQLGRVGWRPTDVDLVAVSQGPGSFTGLRVGITTAKTFAYAVSAHVVGVNTLDIVAAQSTMDIQLLWAVMDAQRNQLFAACYQRDGSEAWLVTIETGIVDNEMWLTGLVPGVGVTGPGLYRIQDRLPEHIRVEQDQAWKPLAATVGQLGFQRFQGGHLDDIWSLLPRYYRKSAAEEKYEAKQAEQGSE